jgi:hypothetical protein
MARWLEGAGSIAPNVEVHLADRKAALQELDACHSALE